MRVGRATEPSGPWQRWGWLMSVVWLGFLYYPAVSLLESTASVWLRGLGWASLMVFAASYLTGFILGLRRGWHDATLLARTLFFVSAGCALLTIPAIGWDFTSFTPFLMAYASYVLGSRWHWAMVGCGLALVAADVAVSLSTGVEPSWVLLGIVVVMVAVNSINVWLIGRSIVDDELRVELATSEQRESIARDVHDLLGHSLTVVKLKAELAIRMLDKDPAVARAELQQIVQLTAEALSGVRSTVTGLRSEGLAGQLAACRSALQSAGIEVMVVGDSVSLSPAQALPAGWIMREATTNILRHAGAAHVRIGIVPGMIEIEDDGCGARGKHGNGLRGMAERAAEAGAVLRIEPATFGAAVSRGTKVSVTW